MEQEKRRRSTNFSIEEKILCLNIIKKYSHIIESKKTDAYTWRDKEATWEKVENEFNSQCPALVFRGKEVLRKFFDNKKKEMRHLFAEINKTGGGPPNTKIDDPIYDLIMSIINKKSVADLTNRFDGDTTMKIDSEIETNIYPCNYPNNAEEIIIISNEDHTEPFDYNENDLEENELDYEALQHNKLKRKSDLSASSASKKKHNSISEDIEKEKEPLNWGNYTINHLKHPLHPNLRNIRNKVSDLSSTTITDGRTATPQSTNKENQHRSTPHKSQFENPEVEWIARRRPRLSNTTSLARKYEELIETKKEIATLHFEILKAEKEKILLQRQREEEQYKLKTERDEEIFKLQRESISLDIRIKKCQLEKLGQL